MAFAKIKDIRICQVCNKEYDVEETRRICGSMHWIYKRCSARCHTKYFTKPEQCEFYSTQKELDEGLPFCRCGSVVSDIAPCTFEKGEKCQWAKEQRIRVYNASVRFKIKIIVEHDGKTYESERDETGAACNHIDNLPGVADYMAKEIKEKIGG